MSDNIAVTVVDTDTINVEVVDAESITVEVSSVDYTIQESTNLVYNEEPTKLSSTQFQTTYNFISDSLVVYLNGLKEKNITVDSLNQFSFVEAVLNSDTVEISYKKQI